MSTVSEISGHRRAGLPRTVEGLDNEERILWASVRLVSEKGFDSVTLFEVLDRADLSRAAFYRLFESMEECLFAAYERVLDAIVSHVARAYEGDGPWPLKVRRALRACLEACSAEPEVARMTTVDVPAAKPEAQRRLRDALDRFVPLFDEGREYAGSGVHLPLGLGRMAMGGAETIIFDEVLGGRTEDLPNLLPEILFVVLTPYIGPEAATAEARRTELAGAE